MLRYEQIIKEYLQDNNVKFKGMQNDDRILVEVEGNQKIFGVEKIDNSLVIKNLYNEVEYKIILK